MIEVTFTFCICDDKGIKGLNTQWDFMLNLHAVPRVGEAVYIHGISTFIVTQISHSHNKRPFVALKKDRPGSIEWSGLIHTKDWRKILDKLSFEYQTLKREEALSKKRRVSMLDKLLIAVDTLKSIEPGEDHSEAQSNVLYAALRAEEALRRTE